MTKTIHVTNLDEIKGLRVVCKKCGANWFVPIGRGIPPKKCFSCETQIDGARILATSEKIREIVEISKQSDFEVLIETETK